MFALTAGENVLGGKGNNCPAGKCPGNMSEGGRLGGECPTLDSRVIARHS